MLSLRCKRECKASCSRANVQHPCLWSDYVSHLEKKRITGRGILCRTMKPMCPAIPEIGTSTPQARVGGVHLLRPCIKYFIPALNGILHRNKLLVFVVAWACNL